MERFKLNKKLVVAASVLLLYTVACKSKFEESSPTQVSNFGISLQERMEQKARIDNRIKQVQEALGKLNTIVKLFKQVERPKAGAQVFTPIDFLVAVNNELKKSVPENNPDRSVRYADHVLPIDVLSDNCKRVKISMITESVLDDTGAFVGEKTTYAAKTCNTSGEFLNFSELDWIGNTRLKLKLDYRNLVTAFGGIFHAEPLVTSYCDIERDSSSIVKAECSNFTVKLSESETAQFEYLKYNKNTDLTLKTVAHIYENSEVKADTTLEVYKNGRVHLQVNKPNQPATSTLTFLESRENLRALIPAEPPAPVTNVPLKNEEDVAPNPEVKL